MRKQWVYSSKKAWPSVSPETQQMVIDQAETVISRLILNYFAVNDSHAKSSLTGITSHWRRHYFYIVAQYHDSSPRAIRTSYPQNLARLEYVDHDKYHLAYFRYTGQWFEIARNITLAQCLRAVAENDNFHPL